MFQKVAPEVVLENHRRWRETHPSNRGERPAPINLGPALYLTDPVRYPFRGRMWRVPPVTFENGVRVLELLDRFGKLAQREDVGAIAVEYREIMKGALSVIRRCVFPHRGLVRRLLWALHVLPNPWKTASHQEVGELLGFFWMLRTSGPARSFPSQAGVSPSMS